MVGIYFGPGHCLIDQQFITLPYALEREAPPFEGNDIKYPEALVRLFLKKLTKPGNRVFDPFAGLGTTLFVAEEMRRIPFGIERDERRYRSGWPASSSTGPTCATATAASSPRSVSPRWTSA